MPVVNYTQNVLMRWFLNNVGLMLLALLFAFAAWLLSTLQDNPIVEQSVAARINVIGLDQLRDRVLLTPLPQVVTATLRGPQQSFQALRPGDLLVNVDVHSLDVGVHVIPLTPTLSRTPLRLESWFPVTATVVVDRLVRSQMPVRVTVVGSPALGFRASAPAVFPQNVVLTASQQIITRVAGIYATVSVEGARSSVQQDVRVYARTAEGELVSGVTIIPDLVTVRIPMEQLSNYRDLPVVVKWRGQPAEGYAVTDISVDPPIVTVFGPVEAVQATKGYIETMTVSISNAQADIDEAVGLNVPAGVSLVTEAQTVRVRVRIQPLSGSRTVTRAPELQGLPEGLSVEVSPDTIDIVLNGPLPRLNALLTDDVRVIIDLSGLGEGVHQVAPRVITPEGITAQSVLPATVQVQISARGRAP
ncbi:MAG: CdaR family protein [Anaerolineae bacterium]|nr:CdaR family protein [Thermoflexales bacterium]MDW8408577.1 CdaR family protein [Anaerolineae bacterium]